ncbi:MAG: hypothetical protein R6U15_05595 [Candidatus Izemoplasmatales bacterium]
MNQKISAKKYQKMVEDLKNYQDNSFVPDNEEDFKRLKETIKVDKYFDLLPNISVEQGWKFDYGYHKDQYGGAPRIFAYKECDEKELARNKYLPPDKGDNYLKHISLDGSADSFLQYIILKLLGEQFALFWHSLYNDKEIVFTQNAVEEILNRDSDKINFDEKFIEAAKKIKPNPYVKIDIEKVLVRIVIFTKWGGFIEHKYQINKSSPHEITNKEEKTLVEYRCGIRY